MRIDSHQHFWHYAPESHGWIDASMEVLKRDFLPPDLRPELDRAGFDGCIAVQAAQTLAETDFLLALAEQHAFIRGVVGWVDLRSPELESTLDRLCAHPRFKGVRHIVQSEPDDFLENPAFRRGVAKLARFDLTYDVLIYERQLPAAAAFVRALPEVRFVLDHAGKPDIRSGRLDSWRERIRAMAACPNVSCKLSGLVTEADWTGWRVDDLRPVIDTVLECFGTERVLLGSDWPVCLLAASYGQVIDLVEGSLGGLTEDERRAVLGANAARAYRLAEDG